MAEPGALYVVLTISLLLNAVLLAIIAGYAVLLHYRYRHLAREGGNVVDLITQFAKSIESSMKPKAQ